jgi:2'-hydroxyisoflavone reductase
VNAEFLEKQGVEPWSDMPAWLPAAGENAGFGQVNTSKAHAAGLKHRPVLVTVSDTLAWFRARPEERRSKLKAGISPERERQVLQAWHVAQSSAP